MAAAESQKQKWCVRWCKEGRKVLSSQEFGVGATASKIQRSSRIPRWHCKRWFRLLCNIHWTRIICVTVDGCKRSGCHIKATRMRRTSSWCSIRFYAGQNGKAPKLLKIHKSECPDKWVRLPRHKWHGVQYGRPSRSSWAKSVRSPFGRTIMGKAIWENLI